MKCGNIDTSVDEPKSLSPSVLTRYLAVLEIRLARPNFRGDTPCTDLELYSESKNFGPESLALGTFNVAGCFRFCPGSLLVGIETPMEEFTQTGAKWSKNAVRCLPKFPIISPFGGPGPMDHEGPKEFSSGCQRSLPNRVPWFWPTVDPDPKFAVKAKWPFSPANQVFRPRLGKFGPLIQVNFLKFSTWFCPKGLSLHWNNFV